MTSSNVEGQGSSTVVPVQSFSIQKIPGTSSRSCYPFRVLENLCWCHAADLSRREELAGVEVQTAWCGLRSAESSQTHAKTGRGERHAPSHIKSRADSICVMHNRFLSMSRMFQPQHSPLIAGRIPDGSRMPASSS